MREPAQVWIWVEDPIDPPKLTIVCELLDATVLKTAEADQVSRQANEAYTKYQWHPVPVRMPGKFVVRGERRNSSANHPGS